MSKQSICTFVFVFLLAASVCAQTGSISGSVWEDLNGNSVRDFGEPGISGAEVGAVYLDDVTSQYVLIPQAPVDANGNFSLSNLPAEDYTVFVDMFIFPDGYTQTVDPDGVAPSHHALISLAAGGNVGGVDFGFRGPGSVNGRIWDDVDGDGYQDAGEPGLQGIEIAVFNLALTIAYDSDFTDANGNYSLEGLDPDDYIVYVNPMDVGGLNQTFPTTGTAHQTPITITPGQNLNNIDFGYQSTTQPGSIDGGIWYDENGDGLRFVHHNEDVWFGDVLVQLHRYDSLSGTYSVIANDLTDSNWGTYSFTGLAAGQYKVSVDTTTLPSNLALLPSKDYDGVLTPHEYVVQLGAGQDFGSNFGYAPDLPTNGLVGYWPMDTNSGVTAYDASGNGYDGTFVGNPTWTGGVLARALDFDGAGDALSFASTPWLATPNQLSISVWVKHDPATGRRQIADMRDSNFDGYTIYIRPDGYALLRVNAYVVTGTSTIIDDGEWHHIVGTYSFGKGGYRLRLYVDGVLDAPPLSIPAQTISVANTMRVGRNYDDVGGDFNGKIDELRIYDRGLTNAEVGTIFAHGPQN